VNFLVRIELHWPPDGDPAQFEALTLAEAQRAHELAVDGTLVRLWRLPGKRANVGLWAAPHGTALHAALASLPFFPWLEIEVTALAHHPNDPGDASRAAEA